MPTFLRRSELVMTVEQVLKYWKQKNLQTCSQFKETLLLWALELAGKSASTLKELLLWFHHQHNKREETVRELQVWSNKKRFLFLHWASLDKILISQNGGSYMEPTDFVWRNDVISYFFSLMSQRTIFSGTHAIFSGTHVVFQI